MNTAQQYMIENGGFSNASGDLGLAELQALLPPLKAQLDEAEASLVFHKTTLDNTLEEITIWTEKLRQGGAMFTIAKTKVSVLKAKKTALEGQISVLTDTVSTLESDITILKSSISAYEDSPVHEQELIVEETTNQLNQTQIQLNQTIDDAETDLASQKKKYLMIGGLAVLVIGLYIVFKK